MSALGGLVALKLALLPCKGLSLTFCATETIRGCIVIAQITYVKNLPNWKSFPPTFLPYTCSFRRARKNTLQAYNVALLGVGLILPASGLRTKSVAKYVVCCKVEMEKGIKIQKWHYRMGRWTAKMSSLGLFCDGWEPVSLLRDPRMFPASAASQPLVKHVVCSQMSESLGIATYLN